MTYKEEWAIGRKAYQIRVCFICGKKVGIPISVAKPSRPCHNSCLRDYSQKLIIDHRDWATEYLHAFDRPSKTPSVSTR